MTKPADDLEAIRLVIQALEPFDSKDRERIIRWAAEKLGMPAVPALTMPAALPPAAGPSPLHHPAGGVPHVTAATAKDIRSFVAAKHPKSDNQMAAAVAYFYHFEAPPAERKESIGKEELIDACRKSDRKRPARPEQVLVNTYHAGLLDKAGSAGQYKLNSVGENLVAMVLPEQGSSPAQQARKPRESGRRKAAKRLANRSAKTPGTK
jgi:hypothetical protein